MKIKNLSYINATNDNLLKPSKEMETIFIQRTKKHISLVKKNLLMMEEYLNIKLILLKERAAVHDNSKFYDPERLSYIWMTWKYYCKNNTISFVYPEGVEKIVRSGWLHHIHNNLHHPEGHLNPNSMSELDIVEMVCDWTAISQEMGSIGSSCRKWAFMNIDRKWCFSKSTKNLIFKTIKMLDFRNQLENINRTNKNCVYRTQ